MKTFKYILFFALSGAALSACKKDGTDATSVSVKTVGVSEIYSDRVLAAGRCETFAGPQITGRGFIYAEGFISPSAPVGTRVEAAVTEGDRFSATISGLDPQKGYYVTAYAVDAAGNEYYGTPLAFVTGKVATIGISTPVIITLTAKTAEFSGKVVDDSGVPAFAFGVEIGPEGGEQADRRLYTIGGAPSYIVTNNGAFRVAIPVAERLLSPGTHYVARMYAQNDATGSYTGEFYFSTPDVAAAQVTTAVELDGEAGKTALTLTSTLVSTGNDPETEFGVVYRKNALSTDTPDGTWTKIASPLAAADGLDFPITITGLTHTTGYGVAAYATNDEGTVYGAVLETSTDMLSDPEQAPYQYGIYDFDANWPSTTERNVGPDYIYLKGSVTNDNGHELTEWGFYISTDPAVPAGSATKIAAAGDAASFWVKKTGLTTPARYYYRTYTVNAEGTEFVSAAVASTSTAVIYDRDGVTRLYLLKRAAGSQGVAASYKVPDPATDTPLYYYELSPVAVSDGTDDWNYFFLDRNLGATAVWPAGTFNADGSLALTELTDIAFTVSKPCIGYYFYFGYRNPAASQDTNNNLTQINSYGWVNGRVGTNPWPEAENPCPKGYDIPTKEQMSHYITAVTGEETNFNRLQQTLNIGVSGHRQSNNGNLVPANGNATQIPLLTTTGVYNIATFAMPPVQSAPSGGMTMRCLRVEQITPAIP